MNLWPFQRSFKDIPCAKEACIAGLITGLGFSSLVFIVKPVPARVIPHFLLSGGLVYFCYFGVCRFNVYKETVRVNKIKEALAEGQIPSDT